MATWPLPPGKDMNWWQSTLQNSIIKEPHRPNAFLANWSPEVNDLMKKMFDKDVSTRPTAAQCLDHPWFKKHDEMPPLVSTGLAQCLDGFSNISELKKAIFMLI